MQRPPPERLTIDVGAMREKLSAAEVNADLRPWGLESALGILETFVCGEERLREWTGEGPINTDDLPYVQYKTRYSAGPKCAGTTFLLLVESVWPYVRNTGSEGEAQRLERQLALRASANALMFGRQVPQAVALAPEDP
ncbi:unnamed protein product, partial [marine sediment metagenome]